MGKKKVLLVDDEESLTKLIKLNLEATGQFEVAIENHGTQAVKAARTFRPDIILLDVVMPDMEGSDVAQHIKEDAMLRSIPIIFLTATVTAEEVTQAGGTIGGETFLSKPVNVQQLIDAIGSHLR